MRVAYAAAVALMLFVMHPAGAAPWVLGASVLWWGLATYLVLTYPRSSDHWASAACKLVIGLLILLPAWQGLVLIKQGPGQLVDHGGDGAGLGADIGAYFPVGRSASASWRR
jgi:phosphatidate cytidylyltransferase